MHAEAPKGSGDTPEALVRSVDWSSQLGTVRGLFKEYRDWLAEHGEGGEAARSRVAAGLQLVDGLIAGLPGAYAPPTGDILLWFEGDQVVACGTLRELEPKVGEIRRIHVRPDYRGKEFGPRFVAALIDRARELGYNRLRVDTLGSMAAAIEFYQEMGFRPIPAFWPHPAAGALFFECRIGPTTPSPAA